jgi:hypothetical protein
MTTQAQQSNESPQQSKRWGLVAIFWAYVGIPFFWGLYQTLQGVTALFTG